jgi:hypothetical protein
MIVADVDVSGIVPWSKNVDRNVRRAATRATRDAIRAMRAEGSRQIRAKYAIRVAHIGEVLSVKYPTGKEALYGEVRAKSKLLRVIDFKPKQTSRGVRVEITKGSPKTIPDGFIATMLKSGHEGVFTARGPKRIIRSGRYKGKLRRPIKEAYTTRVSWAFGNALPAVAKRGAEVFTATFNRNRLLP